ncbi:MAG: Fic family protein, partial [Dehalococcoidia bacterium]|nr:Fic family protein [Dehalococcoidia bacterium]
MTDKPLANERGRPVPTIGNQLAFLVNDLPRQTDLSARLVYLLDEASRAVAMLAGVGETLPNPHLLITPFLRREAVSSSAIEDTQASISDLFLYEAAGRDAGDAREVANYVKAFIHGEQLLEALPLSVRLINQVHATLLTGVRGEDKSPGQIRNDQVWIGRPGTPIEEARFVPAPPNYIADCLADWERFVNESPEIPPLICCAMMHYQFEAIHPYRDGNGRVGRLLIALFLKATGVLPTPLLYLSDFFERNRTTYYERLNDISSSGSWDDWFAFFLDGVVEQAGDAIAR